MEGPSSGARPGPTKRGGGPAGCRTLRVGKRRVALSASIRPAQAARNTLWGFSDFVVGSRRGVAVGAGGRVKVLHRGPADGGVPRGELPAGGAPAPVLGALAGWVAPAAPSPATSAAGGPFTLGVASGDPLSDGVVLWTRLAPAPL